MKDRIGFDSPLVHQAAFEMSDCEGKDYIVGQVAKHGLTSYEYPLPSLIIGWLGRHPGAVLDIGANTGLYTLLAAAISPAVEVFAFEPHPEVFAALQANVDLNMDLAPRIRCVRTALSDRSGSVPFFRTVNDMGFLPTSSSLSEEFARGIAGADYLRSDVSAEKLDDWLLRNTVLNPTLLKIDVESHEVEVLQGARQFFSRNRPLVLIEFLGGVDYGYVNRFIREHDYVNFDLEPGRMAMQADVAFNTLAWNHALCPREKIYPLALAARASRLELA